MFVMTGSTERWGRTKMCFCAIASSVRTGSWVRTSNRTIFRGYTSHTCCPFPTPPLGMPGLLRRWRDEYHRMTHRENYAGPSSRLFREIPDPRRGIECEVFSNDNLGCIRTKSYCVTLPTSSWFRNPMSWLDGSIHKSSPYFCHIRGFGPLINEGRAHDQIASAQAQPSISPCNGADSFVQTFVTTGSASKARVSDNMNGYTTYKVPICCTCGRMEILR